MAAAHALHELAATATYDIAYLFSTFNPKLEEAIGRCAEAFSLLELLLLLVLSLFACGRG